MEIGAVKQSFNNELILLKKKLNQAKTQIIHKLTRKAKQLAEKKAPDAIKEKFTKKAANAVKEVMILKKIKVRDIGRFIVVHTGELQDYLNKPQVDNDKACARILLHKAMQEKYDFIRNKFSNIPIKDLFMSRNERLKLKKEEKLKKKEKRDRKKAKNNVVNAEGDWDVEDIGTKKSKKASDDKDNSDKQGISGVKDEEDNSEQSDEQDLSDGDEESNSGQLGVGSEDEDSLDESHAEDDAGKSFKISFKTQSVEESENKDSSIEMESCDEHHNVEDGSEDVLTILAPTKSKSSTTKKKNETAGKTKPYETKSLDKADKFSKTESVTKIKNKLKTNSKAKPDKKSKDNSKNKNLQNKILNNKFKRDTDDTPEVERKIVDPFFITATGENYMSIVEPRQPDEIKEEHKQGNRKLRRAVMFGHVPKIKPSQERNGDTRFDRQNGFKRPGDKFEQQDSFVRHNSSNNKVENNIFNKRFDDSKKPRFNDRDDRRTQEDSKPEKLHPSWEAKKKHSGLLPYQGKKIVFDE